MHRFHRWAGIAGVLILFVFSAYAKTLQHPFRWVDDEDFKPLIYRNAEGASKGIFYDVITEVFKRMKIPLENRLYPWSRAQKIVLDGDGDGMVTIYTEARKKLFKATDPILTVEEHVFTSRNNPKLNTILNIRSLDELEKFIIVDTIDSGWSRENLKGMHVIWVPTAKSALNMIALQRADIYLMNDFTGPYFIKEQIEKNSPFRDQLREIVMGYYPIATMDYRLLIRKDSPYVDIIEQFNKVLRQMHKDGTFQKIVNRYKIDMRYKANQRPRKCHE